MPGKLVKNGQISSIIVTVPLNITSLQYFVLFHSVQQKIDLGVQFDIFLPKNSIFIITELLKL